MTPPKPPKPPTFRILCEEIYARAVPPDLLADPDYEWRIFPDLGGDYPILYIWCDGEYLPLPTDSDEGREILGGIDLETLHREASRLYALRLHIEAALVDPPPTVRASGLYRLFQAIARHASQSALSPFTVAAAADRILASRFDPEEIALDLGEFTEDIELIRSHIAEREECGEEYWSVVAELLEMPSP